MRSSRQGRRKAVRRFERWRSAAVRTPKNCSGESDRIAAFIGRNGVIRLPVRRHGGPRAAS